VNRVKPGLPMICGSRPKPARASRSGWSGCDRGNPARGVLATHDRNLPRRQCAFGCAASCRASAFGRGSSASRDEAGALRVGAQRRAGRAGRGSGAAAAICVHRGGCPRCPRRSRASTRRGRSSHRCPATRPSRIDASSHGGCVTVAIGPTRVLRRLPRRAVRSSSSVATATPSSTAPIAARATPLRAACPTTAPQTSMAGFAMCAACAPRILPIPPIDASTPSRSRARLRTAGSPTGRSRRSSPPASAAARRSSPSRASVATCSPATRATRPPSTRLRRRKQRDGKPFAVMVANVASARRVGQPRCARARAAHLVQAPDRARAPGRRRTRGRHCAGARLVRGDAALDAAALPLVP
jgi:hypothetical protein